MCKCDSRARTPFCEKCWPWPTIPFVPLVANFDPRPEDRRPIENQRKSKQPLPCRDPEPPGTDPHAEFQKLCIELDAEKTRYRLLDTLAKFLSDDNARLQSKVKHLRIAVDRLESRAEDADAIVQRLRTMSTTEMMCENLNVKHHIEEWEARCLNAEAELREMARDIAGVERGSKPTKDAVWYVACWVRESTVALARKHLKTQ